MKLKIAFIVSQCDHFYLPLYELLAQKYQIHFYFTGGGEHYRIKHNKHLIGEFEFFNLKRYRLFGRFDFNPGLFKLLFRKYDIYIKTIDGRFTIPITYLISRIKRAPFIFWTGLWRHPETIFHKISFYLTKYIYKKCEANLVYGEHIKKYLIDLGVNEQKIFCEHHAVDNDLYGREVLLEEKQRLKETLGIKDEKIILFVGRLEECKGLIYFLEALKGMSQSSLFVIFIGIGELKERLMKECEVNNIKAIFLGYIHPNELPLYYSIADVFVLPSITTATFKEPWGLVINEAMNQGVPIVTTNAVGAAMGGLVLHGQNGLVVPEKNSTALCEALTILLTNKNERQRMSKNAKESVSAWNYHAALEDFSKAIDYVMAKKQTHS